jgi:hypothetical protein
MFRVSHVVILLIALAAGLIIGVKNPSAVAKYSGGLIT